jgi:hypothetical protein
LFEEIYSQHDLPSLGRFETEAAREQMLKELAQPAIDSGLFKEVSSKQVKMEVKYTAEDYLLLLSSFPLTLTWKNHVAIVFLQSFAGRSMMI